MLACVGMLRTTFFSKSRQALQMLAKTLLISPPGGMTVSAVGAGERV